jgi:hypothetical protein
MHRVSRRKATRKEALQPKILLSKTLALFATALLAALVAITELHPAPAAPAASATPAPPATSAPAPNFENDVVPVAAKYCDSCHGSDHPPDGLDLTKYKTTADALADRSVWQKVLQKVQSGQMPPQGMPQPTSDEKNKLLAWVLSVVGRDQTKAEAPVQHVTILRLNKTEYDNTIRDLLGVTVPDSEDFPSDDVGYGFDNIGDVLSISPLLMEKYLKTAQDIAETVVIAPETMKRHVEYEGGDLQYSSSSGGPYPAGGMELFTNGETGTDHLFPRGGDYRFSAKAFGQLAGPDPPKMTFRLDGKDLSTVDIPVEEDKPAAYTTTIHVSPGEHHIAVAFINDYYDANFPDPKRRDRNLIVQTLMIDGPIGTPGDLPLTHTRIVTTRPANASQWDYCARKVLGPLATRAFRRPVTDDELDRLVKITKLAQENGGSFERGIQLGLEAILVSPDFLFRIETPGPDGRLNDYQIASRLSYFLWSSMPDDTLFALARKGTLHDPQVLEAQAFRMLRDPKAHAFTTGFADQWLQLGKLDKASPDTGRFKDFNDNLRAAMRAETETYFESIAQNNGSVLDFLDSHYTYLNDVLAQHYGIAGVNGSHMRRVELTDQRRGGLITQASVLTITSNPTRTSPVKRGKWVLEQILGTPPPPQPPGIPPLPADASGETAPTTLREQLIAHLRNPTCASCHTRMDPIGFGLENFDAVGGWRSDDGSKPIDATGTMPEGTTFNGPVELKSYLMTRKDQFVRALSEKIMIYALGRGLDPADAAAVDKVASQVSHSGYRFWVMVDGIVQSKEFQSGVPGTHPAPAGHPSRLGRGRTVHQDFALSSQSKHVMGRHNTVL